MNNRHDDLQDKKIIKVALCLLAASFILLALVAL